MKRLVVAITGSSGVILGIRLLQVLRDKDIETHLIISPAAAVTISQETRWQLSDIQKMADIYYPFHDIGAALASGSFETMGMVILPCSIKTLSAVANSYAEDLISRAADVTLKEGRPLILAVRETPFHRGHIRLLDLAAEAGAIIFPPIPSFYQNPQSVDALVNNLVGRILARIGIENDNYAHWSGLSPGEKETWPPADLLSLPAMTLATVDSKNQPHAASLYFAADQAYHFYFYSDPDSFHGKNAAGGCSAAVTIHPLVEGWEEIRGLQMEGLVRQVSDPEEREKAWNIYQHKFLFVSGLKNLVDENSLYVFTPHWTRLVDNLRGFGYKEERTNP